MKKFPAYLLATLFLIAVNVFDCQSQNMTASSKTLRHVVLFKFKDGASPDEIRKVENAFRALPTEIKSIKDFEWGINNSPENLNQGLTHCFFVTFTSEKDRNDYLVHPKHMAFVEVLKPYFDKATVIDYWAGK